MTKPTIKYVMMDLTNHNNVINGWKDRLEAEHALERMFTDWPQGRYYIGLVGLDEDGTVTEVLYDGLEEKQKERQRLLMQVLLDARKEIDEKSSDADNNSSQ